MNSHTVAFLSALAGIDTIYDFRAIHDTNKGAIARPLRGTLAQCNDSLVSWQAEGFSPHVMINATDGAGRLVQNVTDIRAQLCDLDGINAAQNYARLTQWQPAAHMIVNTSPGKAHFWWLTNLHRDRQLFTDNQRRLIGAFDGDPQFVDAAHTARLPGYWHLKAQPHFVTLTAGPGWTAGRYDPWAIAAPLMHIPVAAAGGDRKPLGTPSMAAPSYEWLAYALGRIDPNSLGFLEWIAITASVKQAGWTYGEANVRALWDWWCSQHRKNDLADNNKQWSHISETASGWNALVKSSGIQAELMFGQQQAQAAAQSVTVSGSKPTVQPVSSDIPVIAGDVLNPAEQAQYFAGCYWVDQWGQILTPSGRMMGSGQFNGRYGGKLFMLSATGKTTDEAWKAATRGQSWHAPKVDHLRFLPGLDHGAIVLDEFHRKGINTYRKPFTELIEGDVTIFLDHLARLLPVERDRVILLSYLAANVQRPGVKIAWAPVIQSVEGAGKTAFKSIMEKALGTSYVYGPNAKELTEGGGKFNGWMRNRLMIIVDEIRTDDKRDLIEVLKPMISDLRIEMQNKGVDQDMEDNPANWLMFTNYKDAIPINTNGRRYVIFYSALQSALDLERLGMDGQYFNRLYKWIGSGGAANVAHYLMHYPIPAEFDPLIDASRAPQTSSYSEALVQSRSLLESLLAEAIDSAAQGFRGGWVSTVAFSNLLRDAGVRVPGPRTVSTTIQSLGYVPIGKATKGYFQEVSKIQSRLYNLSATANLHNYGKDQGYE